MVGRPVEVASGTGDIEIVDVDTEATLLGYSLHNAGAGATVVYIRSGSVTGPIVAVIALSAAASDTQPVGPVRCSGGIFLDRDGSNAVAGAVYVN